MTEGQENQAGQDEGLEDENGDREKEEGGPDRQELEGFTENGQKVMVFRPEKKIKSA